MDTSRQLALADATGWERGLYEDLMATFRAPIVNWIIRTLTANEPAFMRYLWGQVKPIFDTRGFATVTVTYRVTILSGIAGDPGISPIDRSTLDLTPEAYRDLQEQVATFDIVAPRLAVLFAVLDRGLSGESLGSAFPADADRAVTAPFPDGLDSGRGRPPRLLDPNEIPSELEEVLSAVANRHGLDGGIPSIHRCLAQWPTFFTRSWRTLEPVLDSTAYREARADARTVVDDFVSTMPYQPQLDPRTLRSTGLSHATLADIQDTVEAFLAGPATSVVPTLPMFAAMADSAGPRTG